MGDHNDLGASVTGIELHDRLNRNTLIAKAGADAPNHTRGVVCGETHIIALTHGGLIHQVTSAPAAGSKQGVEVAVAVIELTNPCNVEDVGHHGGCGGSCTCSWSVEHHAADRVTFHQDGVVDAIHS